VSVPAYPAYKDSAVAWLGSVPAQWVVQPLFSVATECDQPNEGMTEANLLSLSYGSIVRKDINNNDGLLPDSFSTYQIVEMGDIVWRLTDLQNDKRSLRTAAVTERGIITSAYLATRPKGVRSDYLNYLLRAYDHTKVFYSMGGGLRQSMKFADVKWLPIVLPTVEEQVAIAAFLDGETGKIDALVEEQRRLIALLQEKRQAVISHAVTKGLDPNAPMKPSGIEWLGDVPAHWEVVALKRACVMVRDGTHLPPRRVDDGIPLLSVRNVQNGLFDRREDDSLISEGDYEELARSFVPSAGDVLLAIVGATLGKAAIVPPDFGKFHIQRSLAVFRPSARVMPQWLLYAIGSAGFQRTLWENVGFSAQPGIYLGSLQNFVVPLPPLEEQQVISAWLGRKIGGLDELIAEGQKSMNLLQERRAALISAAVTGKIDVRGLVAVPAGREAA
jgi:type I restriction enzyme, S subunit